MKMSEAKQSEAWNHTATLVAYVLKSQAGKKGRSIKPKQFHPFLGRQKKKLSNEASRARLNQFVGSFDGKRKSTTSRAGGDRTQPADG